MYSLDEQSLVFKNCSIPRESWLDNQHRNGYDEFHSPQSAQMKSGAATGMINSLDMDSPSGDYGTSSAGNGWVFGYF